MNEDRETAVVADLVADDCARAVLVAAREEPMSVSELAAAAGASESTVRRRTEELADSGLVEEAVRIDAEGHHRSVYRTAADRVTFDVGRSEVAVAVETAAADRMADRFTELVEGF